MQLKDFCRVNIVPVKEKGVSVSNGKRASDAGCYQAGG